MKVPKTLRYHDDLLNNRRKYTSKNKGSINIVYFDTETIYDSVEPDPVKQFKLAVVAYAKYSQSGELINVVYSHANTVSELHFILNQFYSYDKHMYLMAHNMSFDYQVGDLENWLRKLNQKIVLWYRAMTTTLIIAKDKQKQVTILDSMNYFPMSLENLGRAIGAPKMDIDFEACTDIELMKYCENDVRILVEAWSVLHNMTAENWGVRPKLTLASTTMNCYQTTDSYKKIIPHFRTEVHLDSLRSYYGGRIEVFRIGEFNNQELHKLDVNSLYPYIMCTIPQPISYKTTIQNPSYYLLNDVLVDMFGIALVKIECKTPQFPKHYENTNIFPVGSFWTWLSGMELLSALREELIVDCKVIHLFNTANIFSEYIAKLNTLKEKYSMENNDGKRLVTKRLMNSLYGKFGQLGYTQIYQRTHEKVKFGRGRYITNDSRDGELYQILNGEEYLIKQNVILPHTNPHIASNITAGARDYMWFLFNSAGLENCFYSDTDSIIVNKEGFNNLSKYVDDHKMGSLKLEGISDKVTIYGKKAYSWDDKRVVKGIPRKATHIGNNQFEFTSFKTLDSHVFNLDNRTCFKGFLTRTLKENIPKHSTKEGDMIKPLWLNEE